MPSHGTSRRVRVEHIPFGRLRIDPDVQRALMRAWVNRLNADWDLAKCGTLVVSQREDGFYIIDGQHRWAAALARGLGETKARCEVHQNLTREDEADLFLSENTQRPPTAFDKFRVGLNAHHPEKVAVARILAEYGMKIDRQGGDGHVTCPTEVLKLYADDSLRDTLSLVYDTWGTRSAATEGLILGGVGEFVRRYNGDVNRGQLVKKLAKYRGGPGALIGDAKGYASIKPGLSARRAVAELVRDTYNRGRREASQLPPL